MAGSAPFYLRIEFTGLCLLVKDTRRTTPAVHALLLAPDKRPAAAGAPMEKHFADVYHDVAYNAPGAKQRAREYDRFALNWHVDLASLTGAEQHTARDGATALPDVVPDLSAVTGRPVDPQCIGEDFEHEIAARVSIAGGSVCDYSVSRPWRFDGAADRGLVWKIAWLIPCCGWDHLPVWDGTGMRALYPINGIVELRVKNVVAAERMAEDPPFALPHGLAKGHFEAYYDLFPRGSVHPVPEYAGPQAPGVGAEGSLITCMTASGSL